MNNIDRLGIELTRGDGLRFKNGWTERDGFFHYEEFDSRDGKTYLCIAPGDNLKFKYFSMSDANFLAYLQSLVSYGKEASTESHTCHRNSTR